MEHDLDLPQQSAFDAALKLVVPGASGAELVQLFDGKVASTTIINWRAGRFSVPRWAIERVRQISRERLSAVNELLETAAQKETGPGKRAGAMNIKKWNAANPRASSVDRA